MIDNAFFRPWTIEDREACLAILDANTPEFIAPEERQDYMTFLDEEADGYEVCEIDGRVVGAFGLWRQSEQRTVLCWILLDPGSQRSGLGSLIMNRVLLQARASTCQVLGLATSQKVVPFFERFGAVVVSVTKDGWGVGLDRVDMELTL